MWNPLDKDQWRTLGVGAAGAMASGLLMGAAMQPTLGLDKISGPQTLTAGGGPRQQYDGGEISVARYEGQVPEYVIGTDWTRPRQIPVQDVSHDPGETVVFAADEPPEPVQVARARWREEPSEPVAYPSARGGVPYEANRPAPPPPPDAWDFDAEIDAG